MGVRTRTIGVVAGALGLGLAALPAPARAQAGGGVGGAYPSDRAALGGVVCRVGCVDATTAPPGALVRVSGARMARVRTVIFLGGPGDRDDARVRARRRTAGWVEATVPRRASSGRLRVRNADGNPSRPSRAVLQVAPPGTPAAPGPPPPPPATIEASSGPPTPAAAPPPAPAPAPGRDGHVFPVRGPHDFGGAGARFGAGRGDHAHEGHDVFAACGTPLVAARGGRVVIKRFQARAGNYVVVDGEGTGLSYVYMHLQRPALVDQGATVATGQALGAVGDTGVAHGCHLHFELWTAPGWQRGGTPIDPLGHLRAWDAPAPPG